MIEERKASDIAGSNYSCSSTGKCNCGSHPPIANLGTRSEQRPPVHWTQKESQTVRSLEVKNYREHCNTRTPRPPTTRYRESLTLADRSILATRSPSRDWTCQRCKLDGLHGMTIHCPQCHRARPGKRLLARRAILELLRMRSLPTNTIW